LGSDASTITCMPLREEPSFSSRNEKAFASRRVRTQPWSKMESAAVAALRASLTRVRAIIFAKTKPCRTGDANLEKPPVVAAARDDRSGPVVTGEIHDFNIRGGNGL